jgi:hypothetical protein
LSDRDLRARQVSKPATDTDATISTTNANGRTLASSGDRQSTANGSSARSSRSRMTPNASAIRPPAGVAPA